MSHLHNTLRKPLNRQNNASHPAPEATRTHLPTDTRSSRQSSPKPRTQPPTDTRHRLLNQTKQHATPARRQSASVEGCASFVVCRLPTDCLDNSCFQGRCTRSISTTPHLFGCSATRRLLALNAHTTPQQSATHHHTPPQQPQRKQQYTRSVGMTPLLFGCSAT